MSYTTLSPPLPQMPPAFSPTPSLPSPPGYPAPSLPQSTRLSTILGGQAVSQAAPTSPVAADHAPCSSYGSGFSGLPQHHYYQTPDFNGYCYDAFPHGGGNEWQLTEDFEAFLAGAQGSQPIGSHCAALQHPGPEDWKQQQDICSTDQSMDDLSDLCLQDLGDFSLSDLEISAAMIDYLLG